MSESSLSVCVGDKIVCIRVAGRATFACSVDFKTLINSLWQQGHHRFVLDLTNCTLMDSTFLGVLASLGMKFNQQPNGNGSPSIELLNPNPRISELLENLGVAQFFKVINGAAPADRLTPVDQSARGSEKREVSRTCLEAHQFLMDLSPANVAKFKDVTRFLQENLKRAEANGKPEGSGGS